MSLLFLWLAGATGAFPFVVAVAALDVVKSAREQLGEKASSARVALYALAAFVIIALGWPLVAAWTSREYWKAFRAAKEP